MDIAQRSYHARVIKLERTLFAFWPRAEVMSELLVAIDGGPEHIVGDAIAIQEVDGSPLLHYDNVRHEHQTLLVDNRFRRRRRKGLACNRFDVYHRFALHA